MGTVSDWLFWIVGGLGAIAGLAMIPWALFADRSRARSRCPKCWYDLSGTIGATMPGTACPECGRSIGTQRELHRTRRHWKPAAAGLTLALAGMTALAFPLIQSGRWITRAPTTVLILALPLCDDTAVSDELMDRGRADSDDYVRAASRRGIWRWQRWLLARTAPAAAGRDSLSLQVRRNALCMIANMDLDPRPGVQTMLRWLDSGNTRMIQQATLELKCVLHRLGPDLDRCLAAIQAHAGTTDDPTRWDVNISARFGAQARGIVPWQEPDLPAVDQDPAKFVERLQGRFRAELLDLYKPLGLPVQYFTRPFTADPGPFKADRYDLDLDGDGVLDSLVRVGDRAGYYWNILVFLRRANAWTLVDCLMVASGSTRPPDLRCADVGQAGPFLVVRTNAGTGDGYELRTDIWLRVGPRGCSVALSAWSEGHIDQLWHGIAGAPVGAAQLSTTVTVAGPGEHPWLEYQIDAGFSDTPRQGSPTAAQPSDSHALPAIPPIGNGPGEISLPGRVRYTWNPSKARFIIDPANSDRTIEEVEGVLMSGPKEFLDQNAARLSALTLNERSRAWLRAIAEFCGDTPGTQAVRKAFPPIPTDPAQSNDD